MKVKRYVVDTMPDALTQIRSDLGKNAVILNTKEIRTGGIWGLFGKKRIEVMAAVDESEPVGHPIRTAAPGKQAGEELLAQLTQAVTSLAAAKSAATAPSGLPHVPDVLPVKQPPLRTEENPVPAAKANVAPLRSAEEQADRSSVRRDHSVPVPTMAEETILREIRQVKELFGRIPALESVIAEPEEWKKLRERLSGQEVEVEFIDRLFVRLKEAMEESGGQWTDEELATRARERLADDLALTGIHPLQHDTRIVHFVGPTGVGKTTTIAKLAAEQVLKHKRKVGFITSDTYRIAAVEQLKTYAGILNIPLEVVFSPYDLQKAYERLADCDVLFMDTAGRNFRNELYVSELNALLNAGTKSETFLVISLTSKYRDMKVIAEHFCKFKLDKLLFTKMDETDSYGAVYNLTQRFGIPLSYVAHGQTVPDDIQLADPARLANLLLGDEADA